MDPIFRITAWSLNAAYQSISAIFLFVSNLSIAPNSFPILDKFVQLPYRTQVAFSGIWPTVDVDGKQLTDQKSIRRAGTAMADKWAITEFRGDWTL